MNFKDITISAGTSLRDAIKIIDAGNPYSMVLVAAEDGRFLGLLTNGDVTRAMLGGASLNDNVLAFLNKDAVVMSQDDLKDEVKRREVLGKLLARNGVYVPVVSKDGKLAGLLHYTDIEQDVDDIVKFNPGKTVLVVGGGGYLGSMLAKRLLDLKYGVICLDNFMHGDYSACDFLKQYKNFRVFKYDIRNLSGIVRSLHTVDTVVHLAAVVGDPACANCPTDAIEINYLAAKSVAEAAKYAQVNRFLYASTCSVYGVSSDVVDENSPLNPVSLYARSKIKSEEGILEMMDGNFAPTIMRMATLFGQSYRMRYDLVVNTLTMKAKTEGKITIFGGNQWRPLLHVHDAAGAYIKAIEAPLEKVKGAVFNVGSENMNYKIVQLGDIVKSIIPGTTVDVREDSADARSYRVSFDSIKKKLGYDVERDVKYGVNEMYSALKSSNVDAREKRYYNVALSYDNGFSLEDFAFSSQNQED